MTEQERQDYIEFMCNEENEYNCDECPENKGCANCFNPCGQQNCWVTCHCKSDEN
jgi:hypothetical protein